MWRLLKSVRNWIDSLLDMHLSFDGDLIPPDWTVGDGDPHYRPQPATIRTRSNR